MFARPGQVDITQKGGTLGEPRGVGNSEGGRLVGRDLQFSAKPGSPMPIRST